MLFCVLDRPLTLRYEADVNEKTEHTPRQKPARKSAMSREDRLKQALKANLQRRKAQTRARNVSDKSE